MTLENKLGLTNFAELAREEEKLSKKKALALLKNTRRLHDELESCYIPCMNFAEIEKIQRKLIAEINEM